MINKKLSFVIPCYRSEKTIISVIKEIIYTVSYKNSYEIICVNYCSPDGVYNILKKFGCKMAAWIGRVVLNIPKDVYISSYFVCKRYVIHEIVKSDSPIGYSSMMAVTMFIGEYIGRIYISINNSPQYVIKEKINYNTQDQKEKSI